MKTNVSTIIGFAAVLLLTAFTGPCLRAQQSTSNYVMKTTHINPDSTSYARQEIQYYDGLGRPVQMLRRHAATNADDLVELTEYDSLGRVSRTWNPVAIWADGGPVSAPAFTQVAQSYYADECPFSETQYDGTPLNRVRKVTGPGEAWHHAGKGVKSNYLTNTESSGADSLHCIRFGFSLSGNTGITFTRDNLWPAGSLTVERTEDEDGRTLWVFKDMRDLTVLERRLATAAAGSTPATYADTYYLYDNAGRLVAVLPPELSEYFSSGSWSGSTDADPKVEGFAYQYRYDARGRMIAKKLPGAGWTYYVYDKGDRLVLTQDGNQRERNEWSFRAEDALGRECMTGVLTGTYNAFGNPLGNVQVVAARDRNAETYGELHGYLVGGLTIPAGAEVQTVSWWDDYSFLGHEGDMPGSSYGYSAPPSGSSYGVQYAGGAQGLLTGHWSKSMGEVREGVGAAVCETWAYDDHGRAVFHVKGYPSGKRVVERSGYDFVGNLTSLGKTLYDEGNTAHTEAYTYTYDNWGRQRVTTHSLDGGTPVMLSSNSYDSVGRLSGTTRGGSPALASTYTYNVRNWLTGIDGPHFSETLTYETPRSGSSLPGQWGGNISGVQWSTGGGTSPHYDFKYDSLGRLVEAKYGGVSGVQSQNYSRNYSYDLNGNMVQRENPEASIANYNEDRKKQWTWSQYDGNRPTKWMQKLFKSTTLPPLGPLQPPRVIYELDPSGTREEHYLYDADGNRTTVVDAQGDTLNVVRYNRLNLPEEYVSADGDTLKYVYSADGEKLYVEERSSATSGAHGTEYAANYRIENGEVTMIHTDAGYYTIATPPAGGTAPVFEHLWYLKDYLGNNRVLADAGGSMVGWKDYDPFGEEIAITVTNQSGLTIFGDYDSPYRYGGKEWNATTLTYDFEARYLSPSFHRFTTMDPLCEKYYHISPYAYCAGNPVNLVDPSGKDSYLIIWRTDDGEVGHAAFAVENYKQEKYKDKNGKEKTRYVPDGTVTIYDLWPQESVGINNFRDDVPANYHKRLLSLHDAIETDFTGNENRKPEGVIQFKTSYEVDSIAKENLSTIAKQNSNYNALFNNCSDFAKIGVNSISKEKVSGQELLLIWRATTPNALFREAASLNNASIVKDPGKNVNKRFLPGIIKGL